MLMLETRYKDKETSKPLYTSCRPPTSRRVLYPLAFLPKELASHKTFLTEDKEWRSNLYSKVLKRHIDYLLFPQVQFSRTYRR